MLKKIGGFLAMTLAVILQPNRAWALPSFARQTGMTCAVCHTIFPELTAFGRNFKLHGYQMSGPSVKWITDTDSQGNTRLALNETPPLAVMFQASNTFVAAQPDTVTVSAGGDTKGTVTLPSQYSLFYAGSVAPGLGAFIQATYLPDAGSFVFDNTDVRWASDTSLLDTDIVYGLDLNNNPTVEDLWNSTPAWGFPTISPAFGNNSIPLNPIGPVIDGAMAGAVGGLGAYAMIDDLLYVDFSTYRPALTAAAPAYEIQGYAPYWRVALQQDISDVNVMVGTFGMAVAQLPSDGVQYGPTDSFTDVGIDSQVQYVGDDNIVTLSGSWIRESSDYNASNPMWATAGGADTPKGELNHLKLTANYYFLRILGGSISYFSYNGAPNLNLYGPLAGLGYSNNGSPNTNGFIYEADFVPWYNTKLLLQYTAYSEFLGGTSDYGMAAAPRRASDNNTLTLAAWLMY